ncbi:hypothetical protein QW060_05420 [Myroides ceti]|uniref:Transposase n=1 Tax=Paenimyroides ceti TaxID=395087 RepID=A0ABT8CTN4_9FLAO|nr:hypothetical protein [Paenimyroides ceti]MDN3706567.1 hypothetical protein [Paenimyroides ceti]
MDTKLKFSQHYRDGNLSVEKDEIVAVDLAKDKYYARVLTRQGNWVRLSKSFNELTSILY